MSVKSYLLSLPERIVRSTVAVGSGTVRELADVTLPRSVRRSQVYQNVVDATLRFLIEQVGGVEGTYAPDGEPEENILLRRTAGNALDLVGVAAFNTSPVWVLAAMADLCGAGRYLIPEIAGALKDEGLLDRETTFTSVDQILDGLEKTSTRLAQTVATPPLDVATLRKEWDALRSAASPIVPGSSDAVSELWTELKAESARQQRSVFDMSTVMALAAIGRVPDAVRWTTSSAKVGARRTGQVIAATLLDDYRRTLSDLQQVGFASYALRQFKPYVRAAARQFSPEHRTLTDRVIHWTRGQA